MAFHIHLGICTRSAISPKSLPLVKLLSHTGNTAENSAWNVSSVIYKLLTHTKCLHVRGPTNVFFINTANVCIGTLNSPCFMKQTSKKLGLEHILQKQPMTSETDQSALHLKKCWTSQIYLHIKGVYFDAGVFSIRCKWHRSFVSLSC